MNLFRHVIIGVLAGGGLLAQNVVVARFTGAPGQIPATINVTPGSGCTPGGSAGQILTSDGAGDCDANTTGAGILTWIATPSGANLASALTTSLPNTKGGTGGDSSAATGIAHVAAGTWSYSTIVNADVSASAAIALSKLATQAADTIVMNATGGSAVPTAVTAPSGGTNGCAGTTDATTYNSSTHAWGCHQISGGSSPTLQTNTVSNSSQSTLNLLNSAATNGLTLTVTNTSAGNVQLGFTGTLTNAGLANSATTVNGTSCTLGSTCTVTAAAGTLTGTTLNSTVVTSSLTTVGTIGTGVWQGTAVGAGFGGTGQTTYTKGDTLCPSASTTMTKLAVGSNGQVLTADSAQTCGIKWAAVTASAAGSSTQVQFNTGGSLAASANLTWDGTSLTSAGGFVSGTGSTAGLVGLTQGTACTPGTTEICLYAPTSVTSYGIVLPGAVGSTGFAKWTVSGSIATISSTSLAASDIPAVALTTGTSITMSNNARFFECTSTCTITMPAPTAGVQYCVRNANNVSTVITFAAIGSSAMYENTASTAYGTAGTGTLVSGGAVGDKICVVGKDSTHYDVFSYAGTWTTN